MLSNESPLVNFASTRKSVRDRQRERKGEINFDVSVLFCGYCYVRAAAS